MSKDFNKHAATASNISNRSTSSSVSACGRRRGSSLSSQALNSLTLGNARISPVVAEDDDLASPLPWQKGFYYVARPFWVPELAPGRHRRRRRCRGRWWASISPLVASFDNFLHRHNVLLLYLQYQPIHEPDPACSPSCWIGRICLYERHKSWGEMWNRGAATSRKLLATTPRNIGLMEGVG